MKKIIVILVSMVVVAGLAYVVFRPHASPYATATLDDFAKCLSQKGAKMYGTDSCEWCQRQKADFGSSWQFINYVNCISDPQKCVSQNIQKTPTWIFGDGTKIESYQTLEQLSQQSGCELPK